MSALKKLDFSSCFYFDNWAFIPRGSLCVFVCLLLSLNLYIQELGVLAFLGGSSLSHSSVLQEGVWDLRSKTS